MNAIRHALVAIVALGLSSCSEPDKRITHSTGDGAFALTLEAERNWVRPDASLPVLVRLERLPGAADEEVNENIEFAVNNGAISPSRLSVFLAGANEEGLGAERSFAAWVTFTADQAQAEDSRGNVTGISADDQGEIHALFRDVQATFKIRIAAPPASL